MPILFGPSGNSAIFYAQGYKHTFQAMGWIAQMGLNAYEYSFGRGVRIKEKTARDIGAEAKKYGITLSVHAPYYINFANEDRQKRQTSAQYLTDSVKAAHWLGAKRVVFHTGACANMDRGKAFDRITEEIDKMLRSLTQSGYDHIALCPETLGKKNQMGDLNEILAWCKMFPSLVPTIDFGHLNARDEGILKDEKAYETVLDAIAQALGEERASRMHVHFSQIEYTQAGEKKHLTFADKQYGPFFEPLAKQLAQRQWEPCIICESDDTMAEDALTMKTIYEGCVRDYARQQGKAKA